jgi:hypothetical protein
MKGTDSVYGGRPSKAGFKECCVGLFDPHKRESIRKSVKDVFEIHFCHTADGVKLK